MRTIILLLVGICLSNVVSAQSYDFSTKDFPSHLPYNIEIDTSVVRSYQMTTDYYNYDLKCNFLNKTQFTGIISYTGNLAQWKDVYYAESRELDAAFPLGKKIDFLQNFSYRQDDKIVTPEFFQNNLPEANVFEMNLIWDALGFDVMAYCGWDSLKLNEEFRAKNMNGEVEIAGMGTFNNKDIRITWLGITEINGKICAIIKYSVMNNPLKVESENMSMSGRSHYWGEVYVSLSDKQIEHANLTEDVVTNIHLKGQASNILGYTVRTICLEKVK